MGTEVSCFVDRKSNCRYPGMVAVVIAVCVGCFRVEAQSPVRIATYNVDLAQPTRGRLAELLSDPDYQEARNAAEVIQRIDADIILLNEFDYDADGEGIKLFRKNYLGVSQNGLDPVYYEHVYNAPPLAESRSRSAMNTGVQPEHDFGNPRCDFNLDNYKGSDESADAFGYGQYPGQYGFVLLSKYPIRCEAVRTFQTFLWRDIPGAVLPPDPTDADDNGDRKSWYTTEELAVFRLSSKSHWDVPVDIRGKTIHLLASHPTPPAFDDKPSGVDWNKRRNFDEIGFWADYVTPQASEYIYDDDGGYGGLGSTESFVILGDLNADEDEGGCWEAGGVTAIEQLIDHPRVNDVVPTAPPGGGGADPDDTATFAGNMRADYVLPSADLTVIDDDEHTGVFWPGDTDPQHTAASTSDHRLVYVDLQID